MCGRATGLEKKQLNKAGYCLEKMELSYCIAPCKTQIWPSSFGLGAQTLLPWAWAGQTEGALGTCAERAAALEE